MSSVDTDSDTEDHEVVRVNGCDIYYYGDVDRENALDFLDEFKKLEVNLLKRLSNYRGIHPRSGFIYTVMVVTFFRD